MRSRRRVLAVVASVGFGLAPAVTPSAAQTPRGATIAGIVKDESSKPVAGVDVIAQPDNHRTRTDSAGRFEITGLPAGKYTVHARKLGFAPAEDWTADLSSDAHLDIQLTLGGKLPPLDTVYVRADGSCSALTLDGFVCRRRRAKSGVLFLDYNEIDDKDVTYTADLFRDMPGFREDVRNTRNGPVRIPVALTGWRCLIQLVDGRPQSGATLVPQLAGDLVAMEVYEKPDDVPVEYQRYVWSGPNARTPGRCSVVVYWTLYARQRP